MSIPSPDSKLVKRANQASLLTFFLAGFCCASLLSRIPTMRDAMALTPAQMGQLLLIGSLGSVVWLPISGTIVAKFGSKKVIRTALVIWLVGILGISAAFRILEFSQSEAPATVSHLSVYVLAAALFVFQSASALCNSTMNVEGGYVEHLARRPIMPKYHAMFSLGTVTAAGLGAIAIYGSVSIALHLLSVFAMVTVAMIWATCQAVPQCIIRQLSNESGRANSGGEATTPDFGSDSGSTVNVDNGMQGAEPAVLNTQTPAGRSRLAWREPATVLVGLMVFGTGLMEGAANDWLALSMVDGFGFSASAGTLTLGLFLAVLTTVRLRSDHLLSRFDQVRLLRSLLCLGIIGLLLISLSPWKGLALLGVFFWAIGSALGFPMGASALARDPLMAPARMAVISTIGYGAFLVGPPVLGYIAQMVGYRGALGFIVLPVLCSLGLAGQLRRAGLPK